MWHPCSEASSSDRSPLSGAASIAASSPWADVVRGEPVVVSTAVPSSPTAATGIVNFNRDVAGPSAASVENNADRNGKKPAWCRRSNGVIDVDVDVEAVMGAVSWPALGESTKSALEMSPPDLIKSVEGSSASSIAVPLSPMKANPNTPYLNYPNSSLRKPMRLNGSGGTSSSNHRFHLQPNGEPVSLQFPLATAEMSQQIVPEKLAGQGQEPSPRDVHNNRNSINLEHASNSRGSRFSPHSQRGPDHQQPFARRNNNNGGTGGGSHNNGGKRDSDRGVCSNHSSDWNNNPSPRHRQSQQPLRHHPRPFIRPPPPPPPAAGPPFIAPPPVRPFMGPPMSFPEIPPPPPPVFYVQGPPPPFVTAHPVVHAIPPPILVPELLPNPVLKQIEYYFSNGNLCKDTYLRSHMDEQGWVPVALIAGFQRVRHLTSNIPNNINYILDVLRSSELVEVQGEKIRRRGDWMSWVLPPQPCLQGSMLGSHSQAVPSVDSMVDHMQSMVLQARNNNHNSDSMTENEELFGSSVCGNFGNQSLV